ncbi:MAG: hypothetical protein ACXACX_09225 [Candidatus Hodarchaeales archaeon]
MDPQKETEFAKTIVNPDKWKWNVIIGIPTLGVVRIEWHNAFANMIMPMNWSASTTYHPIRIMTPLMYHTAEAQNVIVKNAMETPWEYLLLIEDDVVVPPHLMLRMREWIMHDKYPIISGLYNLKSRPPEPMTFRGRGNASYLGWEKGPGDIEKNADLPLGVKPEEVCFCDGVPTGCMLISKRLLEVAWNDSPPLILRYQLKSGLVQEIETREVFKTVREAGLNPETGGYYRRMGTSDLEFCDKAMKKGWIEMAGFKEAAKMEFPYPVDLEIKCSHIDLSGAVF